MEYILQFYNFIHDLIKPLVKTYLVRSSNQNNIIYPNKYKRMVTRQYHGHSSKLSLHCCHTYDRIVCIVPTVCQYNVYDNIL